MGVVPYTKNQPLGAGGISLRNIVVLLPLGRSQYSLFLHLFRVPSSVTDSGTLIRPRPYDTNTSSLFTFTYYLASGCPSPTVRMINIEQN